MSSIHTQSQHEEQYQLLISNATNAMLVVDQHGIICCANHRLSRLLAQSTHTLLKKALTSLLSESSAAHYEHYMQGAQLTTQAVRSIEILLKVREQQEVPAQLLHISGSSPPFYLCTVHEEAATDTIQALDQAEKIKSAIVDACLDTLITINMDDVIVDFSAAGEKMFGWKRDEVLGRKMTEILIPQAMHEAHTRGMAHYRATREGPLLGRLVQVDALHHDGHTIPVELGLVPIDLPDQHLVTAFLRDISDRKRNEQALLEQKKLAESASKAKSRFLSHMSHEIRSPLNALLGAIDLLKNELTEAKQQYFCSIVESSGHSMLSIINEILDFSKIESGHVSLHKTLAPVQKIIDSVLLVAGSKCSPNVVLYNFTSPSMPETLELDAIKVKQVMTIFLDNAIKYTASGSICLRLDWQANAQTSNQGNFEFEVIDTGIGIAKEHQAHIFAEFEQVDAFRDTSIGGTGLGLAIAKNLIELMHGQVQLKSEPGKGCCFSVKIPAKASETKNLKLFNNFTAPVIIASQQLAIRNCISDSLIAYGLSAKQVIITADSTQLTALAKRLDTACYCFYDKSITLPDSKNWHKQPIKLIAIDDAAAPPSMPPTLFQTVNSPLGSASIINGLRQPQVQLRKQPAVNTSQNFASLLLVEDIEVNRIVARVMLEKYGFKITEAVDGLDALEKLKHCQFDLILMDMRMPKLNGLDATQQIRQGGGINAMIPIIALTANAESMEIERCKGAGVNAFVSKPYNIEHLLNTINMLLKNTTSSGSNNL